MSGVNARRREEELENRVKVLEVENKRLRLALMRIEDWNEHTIKERVNIGAQGQKDYYREIASDALIGV